MDVYTDTQGGGGGTTVDVYTHTQGGGQLWMSTLTHREGGTTVDVYTHTQGGG